MSSALELATQQLTEARAKPKLVDVIKDADTKSPEVSKESTPPETKTDDFKLNFERIAKQEKFNQENRKQIEEKRKEFEKDKEELERYRLFDQELKKDPLKVLEKLGLSQDHIVKLLNESRNPNPLAPEVKEALEIAKRAEAALKERDERDKQERLSKEELKLTAAIDDIVTKEQYDLIEHFEAKSAVREFMEQYFEETGEIPDIKMACEEINNTLVAKVSLAKESKWLKPKEEIKEEPVKKEIHTLSNKMVQSSAAKEERPLTADERFALATQMLKDARRK